MAFDPAHPSAGMYFTTSTVTKPTHSGILMGSLAYETDTTDTYIFNGSTWTLYSGTGLIKT